MNEHGLQEPPLRTSECSQLLPKISTPNPPFRFAKFRLTKFARAKDKRGFDLIFDALPFGRL